MNDIMKKFSAVATIFIPLSTLVYVLFRLLPYVSLYNCIFTHTWKKKKKTGLFGMNVQVPGQLFDNLYWFFGILVFMIVIAVLMCVYFRRQGFFSFLKNI